MGERRRRSAESKAKVVLEAIRILGTPYFGILGTPYLSVDMAG